MHTRPQQNSATAIRPADATQIAAENMYNYTPLTHAGSTSRAAKLCTNKALSHPKTPSAPHTQKPPTLHTQTREAGPLAGGNPPWPQDSGEPGCQESVLPKPCTTTPHSDPKPTIPSPPHTVHPSKATPLQGGKLASTHSTRNACHAASLRPRCGGPHPCFWQ